MRWLAILLGLLRGARTRADAAAAVERIRSDGGLKMKCGCFIGIRPEALNLIAAQAGPGEMLEVLKSLERTHPCP